MELGKISTMQRFLLPRREGFTYAGALPVKTLAFLEKVLQEFSGSVQV